MSAIQLKTEIPGPRSRDLLARREAAVPRGPANVTPIFAKEGSGALLTDVDGNRFIDFAGGIGCLNLGHANDAVVEAATAQLERLTHACFHVTPYEGYVRLAERLNALVPGHFKKKTFFANSGAEAVENAVKIARAATGREAVIAFEDGFHGRTLLAMSLTSKVHPYKAGFGPFAPEIYRVPYAYCYRCSYHLEYPTCGVACADALEDYFKRYVAVQTVAAVIIEPVLGEGGFVVPPKEFLPKLREITARNGILLIADEVQTGFGRTGNLFAIEESGVAPDILIAAKSIAGGLPLSSITGRAEVMDAPGVGRPRRHVRRQPRLSRGSPRRSRPARVGRGLRAGAKDRARVLGADRRPGRRSTLSSAISAASAPCGPSSWSRTARRRLRPRTRPPRSSRKCYERGLVTITAGTYGNILRTLMPLVIRDEELHEGLDVLEGAIREAAGA